LNLTGKNRELFNCLSKQQEFLIDPFNSFEIDADMVHKSWFKKIICITITVLLITVLFQTYLHLPLFSSQAETITPHISILNVQSYPKVGGTWQVSFKVEGTSTLIIRAVEDTTWDIDVCSNCDLRFIDIQSEDESLPIIWEDNCVVIENFTSSSVLYETSQVQSLGKHVLEFSFGEDVVYAYNDATNWWNNNWGYRKKITINHTQVPESLTNFPILVNISDTDLQQKAERDGSDIVFILYEDNTTKLNHEIESYNNGNLTSWVNVTHLSSAADTALWMYYNNSGCTSQENPRDVWDSNYQLIHHLNETDIDDGINDIKDSTVNSNDGTTANMDADDQIPGKINGSFDFDGENDFVNISNSSSLNMEYGITVSAWIKSDSWALTSWGSTIVGKDDWHDGESHGYVLRTGDNGNLSFTIGKNNSDQWEEALTNSEMTTGKWYYVVGTFNGSALKAYINGSEKASTTLSNTIIENSTYPLNFGRSPYDTSRLFDGTIDEIRISNVARNESWIQTSYNTVQNQSIFITFGDEESAAPVVSDPFPSDGDELVPTIPSYFQITVTDPNTERLNITWRTNQSGVWETFTITNGSGTGVEDGTYQVTNTTWVTTYDQPYYWSVNVTDGTHWTNETYAFTMHQYQPTINSLSLVNSTGNKLNSQTGNIRVNREYVFVINATDRNGWGDIDFINLTCWYDQGDETTEYNGTNGGNFNMFLQYQNISGDASFQMVWPDDEATLQLLNCSETIFNETTRIINFSFIPGNQTRCATSNETWTITEDTFDDLYSWNVNCSIADSLANMMYTRTEYGINYYSAIRAPSLVEITGAPGMNAQSDLFTIDFITNSDYTLTIYFDEDLDQVNGPDTIGISGNLSILEDASVTDDIDVNRTYVGVGQQYAIALLDNRTAPSDGSVGSVDVQFELSIPFGTWGTYSSQIIKKIERQ
jgi:hypothetical protein